MHLFVHMLNDFSGSPRILNEKIKAYQRAGESCFVVTGGRSGFIETSQVEHTIIGYQKHANKVVWALGMLRWYLYCFLYVMYKARRGDVVHCNTLLTAPMLLAARLRSAQCVSHVMETRVKPPFFKRALRFFVARFADRVVFLSRYVAEVEAFPQRLSASTVTYPCVDPDIYAAGSRFWAASRRTAPAYRPFCVGLICSLIAHKGYREFIELARCCDPSLFSFLMVVNGEEGAFHAAVGGDLPANLHVRFNVRDVSVVLPEMDVLLSLTDRRGWVETFGLTLIEAMAFGKPVIAPSIGAPTEFVKDGVNGFLVDERDLGSIAAILLRLRSDPAFYGLLSGSAFETAREYAPGTFGSSIQRERAFIAGPIA